MTQLTKIARIPSRRPVATLAFACALGLASASAFAQTAPSSSSTASSPSGSTAPKPAAKKKSTKHHHSSRQPSQKAPTADRISEIQSALSRDGYYQGNPNGRWDASTVAALQKFQTSQGLDPTGKLDARSLQKLGLGSDVAGVSAPKQAPPPSTAAPAPHPVPQAPASSSPSSTPPAASQPPASGQSQSQSSNQPQSQQTSQPQASSQSQSTQPQP